LTQEGVTPNADTIVPRDVVFTLNQYAALYSLTDKDFDLYEDDIAAQMKIQLGERMGLVREMAIYAQMKAATAKFYGGFGSTRASVNAAISDRLISAITRSLAANHAKRITKILSPAQAYGSTSVEASFVCYAHTDLEYDIRRLPGFRETAAYAQRKVISDFELGTWQNVRFVISADLNSIPNAGFAVGSTGLKSTGGANIDVYPMIFLAQDAFAQVKLRGANAIDMSVIMPNQKDSSDPLGQRGYIGAKFWHTSGILNPGWIVVAEVGVDALAA
jgi:N4-gp56 family major capsid protein